MVTSELLTKFGFKEEEREVIIGHFDKTGFPQPVKFYKLSWEVFDLSLEEPYFWILDNFKDSFPVVEKIEDSFAAAENSAFFGVTQQRIGAQQEKVSQFLATTGKMIKELFQMVRELRIIDERLEYYNEIEVQCQKPMEQRSKSAEITMKGLFVDLVQGGGKSPASVYGMARELEFITLPDLFFDAPPFKNTEELDEHVRSLEANFNKNVIRVLQRHLRQYLEWRKRTHDEHKNRRRFQLTYLRQHFDIIQMYINWVKPYLRNVSRLTMKEKNMLSPDLVSAFEGSMLDVEILARKEKVIHEDKEDTKNKIAANGCVLATFYYRTRPEMKVVQEGYQRGPVHVGRFEMNLRVYGWSHKEVENYKEMKKQEVFELMGDVSASVKVAMESLGKELEYYLEEAKGQDAKEKKSAGKPAAKSFAEKFMGDFYTPQEQKAAKGPTVKDAKKFEAQMPEELKGLTTAAEFFCFNTYKNFKKAHRMVMW